MMWLSQLTVYNISIGAVTVIFPNNVKLKVDLKKSTFYIFENGKWVTSGIEYNLLYNGTKTISDKGVADIKTETVGDSIKVTRTVSYLNGAKITDTYLFLGNMTDIEQFPFYHTIEIFNATGLDYWYEIRNLRYSDLTKDVQSPFQGVGVAIT